MEDEVLAFVGEMEVLMTQPWSVGDSVRDVEQNSVLEGEAKEEKEEEDYDVVADDFLSLLSGERGEYVSGVASSESGDDSPRALFLHQFELARIDDVHSPEYAKFRMEGTQETDDHLHLPQDNPDSDNSDTLG